jgi:hypothetical protein
VAAVERLTTLHTQGEQATASSAVSLATLGAVAAVLLVYVSSSFQLADIFSAKRYVQIALIAPIGAVASYCVVTRPARLLDPLILFSVVKLAVELALRDRLSYVLDGVSAVLALTVLVCVPVRSFETAAKVLVALAGILALMALVQWIILDYDPRLNMYVLEPVDEGEKQDPVRHPIALLGLGLEHEFTLAGMTVGRMQSFAKEPSLNVLFFMFPAALAFLRNTPAAFRWGCVMMSYCILSLSGSVFLAGVFAAFWWLVSRVVPLRVVLPYAMLALATAYVIGLHFNALSILHAVDFISQFGDILSKGTSVTSRGQGAVNNSDLAMVSPFGTETTSGVPGPWFVNAALETGWLGDLFLIWFLVRLGRQLHIFYAHSRSFSGRRLGCVVLLGAVATVVVFNDYQMGNYAGLVLITIIYRTMYLANLPEPSATEQPDDSAATAGAQH